MEEWGERVAKKSLFVGGVKTGAGPGRIAGGPNSVTATGADVDPVHQGMHQQGAAWLALSD